MPEKPRGTLYCLQEEALQHHGVEGEAHRVRPAGEGCMHLLRLRNVVSSKATL